MKRNYPAFVKKTTVIVGMGVRQIFAWKTN